MGLRLDRFVVEDSHSLLCSVKLGKINIICIISSILLVENHTKYSRPTKKH